MWTSRDHGGGPGFNSRPSPLLFAVQNTVGDAPFQCRANVEIYCVFSDRVADLRRDVWIAITRNLARPLHIP